MLDVWGMSCQASALSSPLGERRPGLHLREVALVGRGIHLETEFVCSLESFGEFVLLLWKENFGQPSKTLLSFDIWERACDAGFTSL